MFEEKAGAGGQGSRRRAFAASKNPPSFAGQQDPWNTVNDERSAPWAKMSAKDPATDAPTEKDGDEAEAAVVADDEPPAVKHETYDIHVGPFKKGEGARGRALLSSIL